MRWYKQYSDFARQPAVTAIRNEFGHHGYAALILTMEAMTAIYRDDDTDPERPTPELTLTQREWRNITNFSPQKLQRFWEICEKSGLFLIKKSEKAITIEMPIMLKLIGKKKNNGSKKEAFLSEKIPTKRTPEQQQKETEEEKRQNNRPAQFSQEEEIQCKNVLRRQEIDPNSPRGNYCLRQALTKATENPAGYLVGTFKKNPNFGSEYAGSTWERGNGPMSAKDILTQLAVRRNEDTG